LLRSLSILIAALIPGVALAAPVWSADFETGDLSEWSKIQAVSADRLQVVSDPVRLGQKAVQVTVRKGDDPINASGNRNELLYMTLEEPGSEYYYRWSTLFPSSFPSANKWQLFAQWHQMGHSGSPPLELYVWGEEIRLRVGGVKGVVLWKVPLKRGEWQDFVLRVKWSPNASVGFVELHHNGKIALPKRNVATQYGTQKNYFKLGLYRDASISPVGIVYHDAVMQASTLADVLALPKLGGEPAPPKEEEVTFVSGTQENTPDPEGPPEPGTWTSGMDVDETASLSPGWDPDGAGGGGCRMSGGAGLSVGAVLLVLALWMVGRRRQPARALTSDRRR
jgi:hypothetical protein